MKSLNPEIINLTCSFIKDYEDDDGKNVKIPPEIVTIINNVNLDKALETARLFLFLGGTSHIIMTDNGNKNVTVVPFSDYHYELSCSLSLVSHAMLPLPYPLRLFNECRACTPIYTALVDELGTNLNLLNEIFLPIADVDEFVSGLLEISNKVYGPGGRDINDDIRPYITRADFMIDSREMHNISSSENATVNVFCKQCHYNMCLCDMSMNVSNDLDKGSNMNEISYNNSVSHAKLVEINAVAACMSHLSGIISKTHDKILSKHIVNSLGSNEIHIESLKSEKNMMTMNNTPLDSQIDLLYKSHSLYVEKYGTISGENRLCIIYIVRDGILNFFENFATSNGVYERYGIHVKLLTNIQLCNLIRDKKLFIAKNWEYDGTSSITFSDVSYYNSEQSPGHLIVTSDPYNCNDRISIRDFNEVSVVYFRSFYDPIQMDSDKDTWKLRLLLEYSNAGKIPTVPVQLATSKRGQMYWSNPKHAEELLKTYNTRIKSNEHPIKCIKPLVDAYVLQVDPSLDCNMEVVKDAINYPSNYVLKSQREGGFGNFYSNDISKVLTENLNNKHHLSKYVLMKRIRPPKQPAVLITHSNYESIAIAACDSVTELGIYGCTLYDGANCKFNKTNGYLARTKSSYKTGGGVCAGYASVNSLLFY